MFDNIASFDIGSSSVKMIKARRGIKNFQVISVVSEDISREESLSDFPGALDKSLQRILARENLSDTSVILSISTDRLFIRNIKFPFHDMAKIREAIPYEAEENIPYPLDKVSMDFQALMAEADDSRTVIMAAVNRDYINEILQVFHNAGLNPLFAGLEANALTKSYDYFNSVNDETVLLADIGFSKTVISIIRNNSLLYTRSIASGTGEIVNYISDVLKINSEEAAAIFTQLDIDLSSTDASRLKNVKTDIPVSSQKLKKIHSHASDVFAGIIDEIRLTLKAGNIVTDFTGFSRIMLSGGGSNIKGIAKLFGDESGLPVVFMPFMNDYSDTNIRSRFSICFGTLLVYMNNRHESIDFLKSGFNIQADNAISRKYALAIFFMILTAFVFIINLSLTMYSVYKSNSYSNDVLKQKYRRYFNTQVVPKDPIAEATKILQKDRQELKVLRDMLGEQSSFTRIISTITKKYSGLPGFYIRKISYEGRDLTLEGEIKSSPDLEVFKKNLLQTGEFETISIAITDTNRDRSLFKMIFKEKVIPEQR